MEYNENEFYPCKNFVGYKVSIGGKIKGKYGIILRPSISRYGYEAYILLID